MPPVPPGPLPMPPAPVPIPVLPIDSHHRAMNEACQIRLKQLGINTGRPIMASVKPPGQIGQPFPLLTNIHGIEIHKDTTVYCYDVDMASEIKPGKLVVFTKQGRDDYVVLDRHSKCIEIFKKAKLQLPEFFRLTEDNHLIYDGQKLLFSLANLFPGDCPKTRIIQVDTKDLDSLGSLESVMLTISASQKSTIEFTRTKLLNSTSNSNLEKNDRSLTQFLEIVLNQRCIMEPNRFGVLEKGKVYILHPSEEPGYNRNDAVNVGDGKNLLPGMKKTVCFIEGPAGRGHNNPSVVIDGMKAAFHTPMTVLDKCAEIAGMREISGSLNNTTADICLKVMKGLDVWSNYTNRVRHLVIRGIHSENANTTKFALPDEKFITVADYFLQKYNITLRYPNFNLVKCKEGMRENFYPMELMNITPNQRVKILQQTPLQSRATTKACAVLPNERQRLITSAANAACLTNQPNELLKALQIQVYDAMRTAGRRITDPIGIKFATMKVAARDGKWTASPDAFIHPADAPKLWALYCVTRGRTRFGHNELVRFGQMFVQEANKRGVKFNNPVECEAVRYEDVVRKIDNAAGHGCEYIFFITDDSITDLHGLYKMKEREHSMVIQDFRLKTAESIVMQNKHLSMSNTIMKVNCKLGGLNYIVDKSDVLKENILIIGIGTSILQNDSKYLTEGMKALNPTSIGYSSNAVHPHKFTGDFILAPLGQDTIVSVEEIMKTSINTYQQMRSGNPDRIIVYRTGVSEGSYTSLLINEIPLARAAIQTCCIPDKLIYIVASKDHANRFFLADDKPNTNAPAQNSGSGGSGSGGSSGQSGHSGGPRTGGSSRACDLNIRPGVVIDSQVTNPSYKMFFLNSHTTLQGSAKTPSYTVLLDDLNAPLDKLEDLTYTLCHHHQIVALTTSLPAPLYIANEYAKRGRTLWMEKTKDPMPSMTDDDHYRLREINAELSYKRSKLARQRVNA